MTRLKVLGRFVAFIAMVVALAVLVLRFTPGGGSNFVFAFLSHEAPFFAIVVLVTWLMAKLQHRPVADYGLPWRAMFRGQFWRGTLLGFGTGTFLILLLRLFGVFQFGTLALHGLDIAKWAIVWALVLMLVGLFEEYLFRGYALVTLTEAIGFWPAAVVMSCLFASSHLGNPGEGPLGLFNVGLFGLLQCFLLRRTGNLWMPVGLHAAFDWSENYFYGVADSGNQTPGHLLASTSSGPAWLSGGSVGPEGSVMATVTIVVLWLVCAAWLRSGRGAPSAVSNSDAAGGAVFG